MRARRPARHPTDAAVAVVLAAVALGPVLTQRGYSLTGDMVFVPRQPWKDAWLGLDGSVARFVPGDAIMSAATMLLPGDLVQKSILFVALVAGGWGAAKLVAQSTTAGRSAAVVLFCWNPWLFERLSIGQWGSIVGYAALPFVVLAAVRFRTAGPRAWPALLLALSFSSFWSPAASLLAILAAVCVVGAGRRAGTTATAALLGVVGALPWLTPSLVISPSLDWPGPQFDVFTARGESSAGLVASVASLGGIWKESVVPGERTLVLVVAASCALTVLAVLFVLRRRALLPVEQRVTQDGLVVLAGCCFLLTLLPALPGLTSLFDRGGAHVPALGLLRDSHRFLGPAVLVLLPGVAAATDALWTRARSGPGALRAVAILVVVWPIVCLPSMVWGLSGQLRPVHYPDEWFSAAAVVDRDLEQHGGSTVVLPWRGGYRGFAWNPGRAMHDPAPRFLAGDVLIDDRIIVGDRVLENENPRLAQVTLALEAADPVEALHSLGVSRIVVEKGNGVRAHDIPQGVVKHDGRHLTVVSIGVAEAADRPSDLRRSVVIIADLVTLLGCLAACWMAWRRRGVG